MWIFNKKNLKQALWLLEDLDDNCFNIKSGFTYDVDSDINPTNIEE